MRIADGGYRPAYNGQLATDTASQIVVALDVTTQGSDHGQVEPMRTQIERPYGISPEAMLVDGGFVSLTDFDQVEGNGCRIYAPPMQRPRQARDRRRHRSDTAALGRWRRRMRTRAARAIYRLRAATAECVNAIAHNRGLVQLPVRSRAKARCVLHPCPHTQLLASPLAARHARDRVRTIHGGSRAMHRDQSRASGPFDPHQLLLRSAHGGPAGRFLLGL